ncbi:ribosome-binding factor A [Peptoclostridium acidaminophilum DSM 3953]|uniref:Ribosome-binding factor A n=1 Tax=Peptoclostridium acidaminophilum DSM 3953 TaxID=1286171 RepID=W8T6W1_PEPAC|nr:ribosome-binding factor A [Peptoclostridium acidaminophilum DSM 3953]
MGQMRLKRIGEEIKKIISTMIQSGEIKDPRVSTLTSITEVDVTEDFKYAYVYVSVLMGDKEAALKGLKSASGFIRKEIGRDIKLRYTPEVVFKLDDSIERGIYMSKLIDKLKDEEGNND